MKKTKKITLINENLILILALLTFADLICVLFEATTPSYWPMLKYTVPTTMFLALTVNLCLLTNMNKRSKM